MPDDIRSVIQQLLPVFREVFDDDSLVLTVGTTAQDVDGWDSLNHIQLMVSIEKAFGVRFSADEAAHMANIGDLAQLILHKRGHA
jgi:acyl carrier protein